jgi:hypothetical protein
VVWSTKAISQSTTERWSAEKEEAIILARVGMKVLQGTLLILRNSSGVLEIVRDNGLGGARTCRRRTRNGCITTIIAARSRQQRIDFILRKNIRHRI